jgi:hypothetical protein
LPWLYLAKSCACVPVCGVMCLCRHTRARVCRYAPHVRHIVMDVQCRVAATGEVAQGAAAGAAAVPLRPGASAAHHEGPYGGRQAPGAEGGVSGGQGGTAAGDGRYGGPSGPREQGQGPGAARGGGAAACEALGGDGTAAAGELPWWRQPYRRLARVQRLRGVDSREAFEAHVSPLRRPVVLEGERAGYSAVQAQALLWYKDLARR